MSGKARALAAFSILDAADAMGACNLQEPLPIERPARIETVIRMPSPNKWPDCPLCRESIVKCECDPAEYAEAVYREASRG